MKNNKLKVACLVAATMILPVSQAVVAGEATWGLSGWVNEGITGYSDGEGSGVGQVSDNGTTLGTRLTFSGTYEPDDIGLKAGFEVTMEPRNDNTPLFFLNQDGLDKGDGFPSSVGLLAHNVFLSGVWGKVTIGKQSMPTDNIAVLADPSGTIWSGISPAFRANGFFIRGTDPSVGTAIWGGFLQCHSLAGAAFGIGIGIDCNGIYRSGVRYDLPAFDKVSVAVGWANTEIYDIAMKYADNIGDLKVQFNAGYSLNKNGGVTAASLDDTDLYQFQLGVMHEPTGLFGVASYQNEQTDDAVAKARGSDDTDAYYFKGGIRTQWNSFGDTAIFAEYGSYNDQYGAIQNISGSELERMGVVVEQYFGSRLVIYGKAEQYALHTSGIDSAAYNSADDLMLYTLGLTYFF